MKLSNFFINLYESYQAELDDLTLDSEGVNVLQKRLKEKRQQIDFLVVMIDHNPELLAPAFYQGFAFSDAQVMEALIHQEPDDFPAWLALAKAIQLTTWAKTLSLRVLQQAGGERFLILAAALEYIRTRPAAAPAAQPAAATSPAANHSDDEIDNARDDEADDGRDLDEAGADWMEQQGFERKN